MARMNKIREAVFRKQQLITDEELFASDNFLEFLQHAVNAAVQDTGREVRLHRNKSISTAQTTGTDIEINMFGSLVTVHEDRQDKYLTLLGEIVHEAGHCLYTDFVALNEVLWGVEKGELVYANEPKEEIKQKVKDLDWYRALYASTLKDLANIAEDSYINLRCLGYFGGYFQKGLKLTLKTMAEGFEELQTSYWKACSVSPNVEMAQLKLLCNACLMANNGVDVLNDPFAEKEDWFKRTMEALMPMLVDLRTERNSKKRWNLLHQMMEILTDHFPNPETTEEEKAIKDALSEEGEEGPQGEGRTKMPKGSTYPIDEKRARSGKPGRSEDKEEGISEAELMKGPETVSEEMAEEALDEELTETEQKEAGRFLTEGAHRYQPTKTSLKRETHISRDMIKSYDRDYKRIATSSKKTQRKLLSVLKERAYEGKINGLAQGKRISVNSIQRGDGKIFSKKLIPDGDPNLAVCVLVDCSGSMDGDRMDAARKAAILLDDVLTSVNVPHSVFGHTADRSGTGSLNMISYINFDEPTKKAKYRLANLRADYQNRDGNALEFCYQKLLKRPEERKLLIVISDGTPCAHGYGGSAANEHTQSIVKRYARKVDTFAAAIGSDVPETKEIYGNRVLVIDDLAKLPTAFAMLVKNYVLR